VADLAGLLRGKEGVCTDELAHVDGWSAAFDPVNGAALRQLPCRANPETQTQAQAGLD